LQWLGYGGVNIAAGQPCNLNPMTRTLQIRGVPDDVHAAVRVRAAQAGVSVSDYLLRLVVERVTVPTMSEIVARAQALSRSGGGTTAAEARAAVRAGRER